MTREEAKEIAAIVIRDMKNGDYPSVKSYKLVAALETLIQSPWIYAKRRLPEECLQVLVKAHAKWREEVPKMDSGWPPSPEIVANEDDVYTIAWVDGGKWQYDYSRYDYDEFMVIKWMEIPD